MVSCRCLLTIKTLLIVAHAFRSERVSGRRRLSAPPSGSMMLQAVQYEEGSIPTTRISNEGTKELNMYYRVYNPESMQRKNKSPLVILHGGPSLPSQYLYSIADNIPQDRSIVFYDQIGCGRSSEPSDISLYSIEKSVDDLEILLNQLDIKHFHLLGHSYGGVLAYEYARKIAERANTSEQGTGEPQCISITIANTSTNMAKGDKEWGRLAMECALDTSLPGKTPDDKFFRRNLCRLDGIPSELTSAFDNAGQVWFGTDVIIDWTATPFVLELRKHLPPFMLVTGEHDFVTESCTEGWQDILQETLVKKEKMMDCSHYVHLENPILFGSIVENLCSEHDV